MDFQTLVIIVVIGLLVLYLLKRNQSSAINPNAQSQGSERPIYNDPNVEGQGSFGRDRDSQSASERRSSSTSTQPSSRNNDPNVEGRGSFGRDSNNESSTDTYRSRSVSEVAEEAARANSARNNRDNRDDVDSQSAAERARNSSTRERNEPSPRNDDQDVEGRGSFGRDKD